MSKTYLPYDPDQQLLLPAALQEWLPDDHLAYFISDVVDQLDLSWNHRPLRGRKAGWPALPSSDDGQGVALRLLHRGGVITKRIAQRLHEDIAFRVLAANNTPDFRTISDFRKDHLAALAGSIPAGAGVLPAGGAGEAGSCGTGRHQGEGQRIQAQGDELSADERARNAVGGGGGGVAAAGSGGR